MRSDQKPILLVDDLDDDVFLFKRALKKAALNNPVQVVGTARVAMQYLLAEGIFADRYTFPFPSVFVIDLHLPDLNGFELLKWVRSLPELQSLYCLILTGDLRPSLPEQCYAVGAHSFLYKPCEPEDLRNLAEAFSQHWLPEPLPLAM